MDIFTLDQAFNFSGVYNSDSDFEKDCKLMSWIGRRRHRCILFDHDLYESQIASARADGIELVIVKKEN